MKLVLNTWQFDVLITTNLFADILSDLVGGLGMASGLNIGADAAITTVRSRFCCSGATKAKSPGSLE
jgi:isocitrate/isopropylmalate dehydrogenase